MTLSDRLVGSLARVFATNSHPWEQQLDDAARIIGEAAGEMCLVGAGISGSAVFRPVGVYHSEAGRQSRINDIPGFTWPMSKRASIVLAEGEPFIADASTEMSDDAGSDSWSPWRDALQESGRLPHMMLPIQFSGVSVGLVVVARHGPGRAYCRADAQALSGALDVLALALRGLSIRPDLGAAGQLTPQVTRANVASLSSRERQVVVLLAQGMTSAEIGTTMFLSRRTVEWYRARILQKLDHPTRADLVALGRGFLD